MKKQYILQKYVMADSVEDALKRAKKLPVHEVYVHSAWLDKQNSEFYPQPEGRKIGLDPK